MWPLQLSRNLHVTDVALHLDNPFRLLSTSVNVSVPYHDTIILCYLYFVIVWYSVYQYIKILTVCVSVCNGSGMFVGRD